MKKDASGRRGTSHEEKGRRPFGRPAWKEGQETPFFHPDCTVGSGFSPDLPPKGGLAGSPGHAGDTAGTELGLSPRTRP